LTGENRRTGRKSCPSATLPTTNLTWIDPGTNPGLRGQRPATNDLSHGTGAVLVMAERLSAVIVPVVANTSRENSSKRQESHFFLVVFRHHTLLNAMKLLQLKLNFNGPLPLTFSHSVPAFKKTHHDRCKGRSCNDVRTSCVVCSEKQVRPVKVFYEQDAQLLNVKLMELLCMLTAALNPLKTRSEVLK
jgi:hypothetical protein